MSLKEKIAKEWFLFMLTATGSFLFWSLFFFIFKKRADCILMEGTPPSYDEAIIYVSIITIGLVYVVRFIVTVRKTKRLR